MRKEKLLEKKMEIVNSFPWYVQNTISEKDVQMYSIRQLENMKDMLQKADAFREDCSPFYALSATEILQKESSKIASFEEDGIVREKSREEIMNGASRSAYMAYMEKESD